MKYAEFETLKTARLWLRKMTMEDAQTYFERLASSEAVTRYMLFSPQKELAESVESVKKALARYESRAAYRWVLDLPGEGLIGVVDLLRFDEESDSCSFAYMIGEDYWGMGYGTEAVKAVFGFAFEKMELSCIEADHMAENPASGAVMRKAGMQYVRTDKAKYEKNGARRDAHVYRITRQDWRKGQ